jgi:prolyl-tRNA synthetase
MRLSQLIGRRYKETPAEASLTSHAFLLRGGYIRPVASGLYSLLPLGVKVARRIERIIREEMDRIGGQEVRLPVLLPRELWDESGRYASVGPELFRLKDRCGHDLVLGMTHEEAVVHAARGEADSYKNYPFMLYQIRTKLRDEPRPRGGLVRVREFTMKDAYSFHTDQADLERQYAICAEAYRRIFERVGLPEVRKVESDSGMMGGKVAHEYMLLADGGEDTIAVCGECDYAANREVAAARRVPFTESPLPLKRIPTPGKRTIDEVSVFLSLPAKRMAKMVFYEKDAAGTPVAAIVRGDCEVNETKLAGFIGVLPEPARDETIRKLGAVPGYASAIGLTGCRVIADFTIVDSPNLITGANEENFHLGNFNLGRDCPDAETVDIAAVREGDGCPHCAGKLALKRGIEVGNIFQLGTKYTGPMGMRFLDAEGWERTPVMGCYGIGVERLAASIIEARHDDHGPIWPASVAPFTVELIAVNLDPAQRDSFARPLYEQLLAAGIDVLYDDREERPGVQFADADLIGAPLRLIASARNYEARKLEWKSRDGKGQGMIEVEAAVNFVVEKLGGN